MKSFKHTTLPALALLCASLAPQAWGQQVYRCGNSYSQSPCAGGVTVNADDSRTDAQRAAAKEGLARDKALGKEMETSRRKDEAEALARDKAAFAAKSKADAHAKAEEKKREHEEARAKKSNKKHTGSRKAQASNAEPGVFTTTVRTGSTKTKK